MSYLCIHWKHWKKIIDMYYFYDMFNYVVTKHPSNLIMEDSQLKSCF